MATTPRHQVQQMLAAAADAADDRKAEDIRILALDPAESGLSDYFLICSGNSERQNVAIIDAIELKLKQDFGTYPTSVEGRRQGDWILMDYVDFIVHVFSTEKRAFYGLERLRKSATSLTIKDLNAEITSAITTGRGIKSVSKKAPAKVKSPLKSSAKKAAVAESAKSKKAPSAKSTAKKAVKKAVKKKSALR